MPSSLICHCFFHLILYLVPGSLSLAPVHVFMSTTEGQCAEGFYDTVKSQSMRALPSRVSESHLCRPLSHASVFYLYHPIGRDRPLVIVMPTEKLTCTPSACFLYSPFCGTMEASASGIPSQSRKYELTPVGGGTRTR